MTMRLIGFGTGLLVTAAVAASAGEKLPKCFSGDRDGHCIAVEINGQKTIRLTKPTKKMLEPLGGLRSGGDNTRYEAPQPVRGALDVRATWLPEAVPYFGAPPSVTVHVEPLEGQELATRPELSTDSSVQAGGSAVVTQANVIESNRLPPGKYLLSVTLSGARKNWDRQTFYVQVVE